MIEQDPIPHLVEKAKNGDRAAFDRLAEDVRARLQGALENWTRFQVGPALDVEEVLQDTLLRAYRSLDRFEWQDEDSFFRWLCGIAKRALAEAARQARRAERSLAREPVQAGEPSPSAILRRRERFDRLEQALEDLGPDHREVILLCRIEGLTSAEVAERLNRSPAAVRQLLVRALRELKKNFGDTASLHLPDRRLRAAEEADEGRDGHGA
jgi:RNA polymerase sigma-70 factor (ECF subfamily)